MAAVLGKALTHGNNRLYLLMYVGTCILLLADDDSRVRQRLEFNECEQLGARELAKALMHESNHVHYLM